MAKCSEEAGENLLFWLFLWKYDDESGFVTLSESFCGILICYDVNRRFLGDAVKKCRKLRVIEYMY